MYLDMKNFSFITEATARGISDGKVTYVNAKGAEKSIQADSAVVYAGFKPRLDEALKFSDSADRFLLSATVMPWAAWCGHVPALPSPRHPSSEAWIKKADSVIPVIVDVSCHMVIMTLMDNRGKT